MTSRIKAAVSVNKPPLAVILGEPDRDWTVWDLRLVTALVLHEEMTNGSGIPIYWDRSERVQFEVKSFTSKSKAALDRAEEKAAKGKNKNHGKVFYAVPRTTDGGPLPTLEEFLEQERIKREMSAGNFRVGQDKFSNAGWKPKDKGIELG